MGDHHLNDVAKRAAAIRGSMPPQRMLGVDFQASFAPKLGRIVMPADRIREVEGKTEICLDGDPADPATHWSPTPEGAKILTDGVKFEMADLDFTVMMVGVQVDGVLTDGRGQPRKLASPLAEVFRQDATEYVARFGGKAP